MYDIGQSQDDLNLFRKRNIKREKIRRDYLLLYLDLFDYQKGIGKYKNENLDTIFTSIEEFLNEAFSLFDYKNDELKFLINNRYIKNINQNLKKNAVNFILLIGIAAFITAKLQDPTFFKRFSRRFSSHFL